MCACLCVTGCREQADLEVTGGRFDITLQDGSSAQPTRVRPYEVTGEMKKQFVLHIADETDRSWFSGTMEQYEKASPALKPGNFALSAYLGDNLPLALDAPYYVADNTTASIRAGQATPPPMFLRTFRRWKWTTTATYRCEETQAWKCGSTARPVA